MVEVDGDGRRCIFEVMPRKGGGKEEEEEGKRKTSGSDVGRDRRQQQRRESLMESEGRKRRIWNLNTLREVMVWRRR